MLLILLRRLQNNHSWNYQAKSLLVRLISFLLFHNKKYKQREKTRLKLNTD